MGEQVRPRPVRTARRGRPEDVLLSRQMAAAADRVRVRRVLCEPGEADGWSQPSLFSPWDGPWQETA